MFFRTKRLILRPYSPADAADLHEIFSDPLVMEHCETPYTPEQTRQALSYFIEKGLGYAVALADSGKVIGHLLFHQFPMEDDGIYEIGWFFNRE